MIEDMSVSEIAEQGGVSVSVERAGAMLDQLFGNIQQGEGRNYTGDEAWCS